MADYAHHRSFPDPFPEVLARTRAALTAHADAVDRRILAALDSI